MRKVFIIASALALVLVIIGWRFQSNGRVQAVNLQISVKDIPKHGLVMISPSDPSFESRVSALLKDVPNGFLTSLKPFSVFMENRSNKAVVAYTLKWEMVKANGTVTGNTMSYSNPRALMDGGLPGYEYLLTSSASSIEPNSARLISLGGLSVGENFGGGIGGFAGGSSSPDDVAKFQQAAKSQDVNAALDYMLTELQGYKSITISIDGAFFEDGKFVGANTTQTFENTQAIIEAKRDLVEEIAFAIKHKKNLNDLFSDFEEVAKGRISPPAGDATPSDHYTFHKNSNIQEFLRVKEKMGTDKAISMQLQMLRKPWVKLNKVE